MSDTTPAPICFIDTETTGLHRGRLTWEVGMIRRDQTGRRELSFFVEVDLSDAEPMGLKVGRFYERHPLGQYLSIQSSGWREPDPCHPDDPDSPEEPYYFTRDAAALTVATWTHGAHIVGAIPSYDTETDLRRMIREAGLIEGWHHHLIDVEALAVGYLKGSRTAVNFTPPWKSDDLNRLLGLPQVSEDERHTALGDCRWAERMYDKVMGA